MTYEIEVKNTSNVDLHDVKVVDKVPGELTVTGISDGGVRSGNEITWLNIFLAKDGGTKKLTFTVQVKESAGHDVVLNNEVTASSHDHGISDTANDRTTVKRLSTVAGTSTPAPVVQVVSTPSVIHVPITAKTGAGMLASLMTVFGTAGLILIGKKSW